MHVLLLRAPSIDEPDRYESALRERGYTPCSVPVLETVLVNTPELVRTIEEGPAAAGYQGVIVTSARACEAWKAAVRSIPPAPSWHSLPFHAVGEATKTALLDAGVQDVRGGAHAGTAEKLAHLILDETPRATRLLYLTGDKNRDTLPALLRAGGVEPVPLQVYETRGSSAFAEDLESALSARDDSSGWWIVFFAPSSAAFTLPHLRRHFTFAPHDAGTSASSGVGTTSTPSVAAIGPTTSAALRSTLNIRTDVEAAKPTPQDLAAAIASFGTAEAG